MHLKWLCPSLGFVVSLSACQSPQEKMETLCEDLRQTATLTDDCPKMAKKLPSQVEAFFAQMDQMKTEPKDETTMKLMTDAVSQCLSALLEISTGVCAQTPEIRDALSKNNSGQP